MINCKNCLFMYTINMSKVSIYRKVQIEKEKKEIFAMYKKGISLRKVADIFNVSHSWVYLIVKEKMAQESSSSYPQGGTVHQ